MATLVLPNSSLARARWRYGCGSSGLTARNRSAFCATAGQSLAASPSSINRRNTSVASASSAANLDKTSRSASDSFNSRCTLASRTEALSALVSPGYNSTNLLKGALACSHFFSATSRRAWSVSAQKVVGYFSARSAAGAGVDRLELLPVESGPELFRAFTGESGKVLFQFVHRFSVRGDGLVDVCAGAEVAQGLFQVFKAETFDQELHDQRRFVVGELYVQVAFRRKKRRAQFAQGGQVIAQDHFAKTRGHRLAPGRVRLFLLVNRDAFAEPAGHFVARQSQRDDVTELVPEHRFPVRRMRRLRRRTVRRDNVPETNAEKTRVVGHAKGAHGKILLLGKNLDRRPSIRIEAVLFGQAIFRALQQFERAVAVNRGFAGAHPQDEILIRDGLKLRQAFAQGGQIVGRHVVTVPLMHLVGELPAFILVTEPEQVLR